MDEKNYFRGWEEQANDWVFYMLQFEKTKNYVYYEKAENIYATFKAANITEVLQQTMDNRKENES